MGKSQERFGFAPNPSVSGDSKLRGRTARNFCGPMEEMAKPRTAKTGMCVCGVECVVELANARQYGAQQVSSVDSCVRGVSTTTRGRGREARGERSERGREKVRGRERSREWEGGGRGREMKSKRRKKPSLSKRTAMTRSDLSQLRLYFGSKDVSIVSATLRRGALEEDTA